MACRSKYLVFLQAVPSRIIWRRPLMVRQPYSVAVPSTGGRLHPRFLRFLSPRRGTEGVVKTIEEGLGEKVELSLQERRRGRKNYSRIKWTNLNHFSESLLKRYRKTENFLSIRDLSDFIQKQLKKSCFLLNEIKKLTGIICLFTIKFVFLQRDSVSLK